MQRSVVVTVGLLVAVLVAYVPASPDLGVTAAPLHMHATPASVRLAPPVLGQHTQEILEELGYQTGEIRELAKTKVLGMA